MTDEATAEVESQEEAEARGYRGEADPTDRDEYTLTTGPESPGLEAQLQAKIDELQAQLDDVKARVKERAGEAKETVSAKAQEARATHEARKSARSGGTS